MNFSSMEYFTVLAQERSFTHAAERLHITQQSLSAHIAGMEQELGCQLVVRRIPLELTYAGTVLLRYATDFQQSYIAMKREFSDISQNHKGVLRVGIAATRGRVLLPDILPRFQQRYPNITVALSEGSNSALHQMLLNGTLDVAIADFPILMSDILLRLFYRERIVLLIRKTLFQSVYGSSAESTAQQFREGNLARLVSCPLVIGTEDDIDGRIGYGLLGKAGISTPIVRAVSHNVGTLLSLCLQGIGACFCPENLLHAILPGDNPDALMRFDLGNEAEYTIRFGYRKQPYQWAVISDFMDIAEDVQNNRRRPPADKAVPEDVPVT